MRLVRRSIFNEEFYDAVFPSICKAGLFCEGVEEKKKWLNEKKKNNLSVYYKIIDSKREFKEKQRCALLKGGNVLIYETEQCEKKKNGHRMGNGSAETGVHNTSSSPLYFLVWALASNVLDQLRQ